MNKVIREASTGILFIYGETFHGKDYFITPDDALDAVLVTMGVLEKLWERELGEEAGYGTRHSR